MSDININLDTINGDFSLLNNQEALLQDENIIIISDKGKIYNFILLGVSITKYLNSPTGVLSLQTNIRRELKKDNIIVQSINVVNGEVFIKSYRN